MREWAVLDIASSALGHVLVTSESDPLGPVLGLTREQLVQSLELTREQERPGLEFLGC